MEKGGREREKKEKTVMRRGKWKSEEGKLIEKEGNRTMKEEEEEQLVVEVYVMAR